MEQQFRVSLATTRGLAATAPLSEYASRQHRSLPHHAARARALPVRAAAKPRQRSATAGASPPCAGGDGGSRQDVGRAAGCTYASGAGELGVIRAGPAVAADAVGPAWPAPPIRSATYILRSCCATIELGGDCSGLDQSNLI